MPGASPILFLLALAPAMQLEDFNQYVANGWKWLADSFWNFINTYIMAPIGNAFSGVARSIGDAFAGFFGAIRDGLMGIVSSISGAIGGYFGGFNSVAQSAFNTLTMWVGGNPMFAMLIIVLIPVILVVAVALVVRVGKFAL